MKKVLKITKIDVPIQTKTGSKIYNVYAENDSTKYTCFDSSINEKLNQEFEYDLEVKQSGNFTNHVLTIPKSKNFTSSNKNTDRQIALQSAVLYMKDKEGTKKENVLEMADYFLQWLKK